MGGTMNSKIINQILEIIWSVIQLIGGLGAFGLIIMAIGSFYKYGITDWKTSIPYLCIGLSHWYLIIYKQKHEEKGTGQ
jgi:hypothetical protein